MQKLSQTYIKSLVKEALNEDLKPKGDITTNLVKFNNKKTKAQIIAKQNGVIAGLEFCKIAFKLVGKEAIFVKKVSDGTKVKKNKVIAEIKAKIKTILIAERTALNFLNHASGIATLTNEFVKKAGKTKICCTRKTTPNLRTLERELVKKAIKTNKVVTVEIENIKQLNSIIDLKFKRVLFDNMSIQQLKKCLNLCKNKFQTEYSGNATLKNIKKISKTGIDRISVGAITHSSTSFDSSLLFR